MTEHRVVFDFEIDFSNEGGIQGQGFRLDIPGEDISDQELASRIIRDLRLLMVDEVRILKKRIIAEAHKRNETTVPLPAGAKHLVDLSHAIESGMVTNTGTYIDVPSHRYPDGDDLAATALDHLSALRGVVVRVSGMKDRAIDWTAFAGLDVSGKAVLIQTDWDRHWRTDQYVEGHPYLTQAAAMYLRNEGVALVGIDALNIDCTEENERPVHSTLLSAGIPIVEHLTNLGQLPTEGFWFHAVPPKISGMGTFPVRAHALVEPEGRNDTNPI